MLWLKRNMFLVVCGSAALLVIGGVLFFLFQSVRKNKSVEEELEATKSQLDKYYRMEPFPADTNIATARKEVQKLQQSVNESKKFFAAVPYEKATGMAFKTLLDKTIFNLTRQAERSSIALPVTPYYFSFAAQKESLNLNPASFPAITEQLGEVELICKILFESRIHALTSLKRTRLTNDDPPGSVDYREDFVLQTNAVTGAVLSPYEISFTGFSSDLATVLERITRSQHGLLIRAIMVDRFEQKAEKPQGPPVLFQKPSKAPPPKPPTENQTILNEERFQTTLLIAVVKPAQPQ
jgi:uncharacterized membrane-anchored protein YhcB (DUF1043 family)